MSNTDDTGGDDEVAPLEAKPVVDVQGDGRWLGQHERFIGELQTDSTQPVVVFLGDSLVQLWRHVGAPSWQRLAAAVAPRRLLNFGIGGDRVEHVLWRAANGELAAPLRADLVVVMCGTNNFDSSWRQILATWWRLVEVVTSQQPDAQVLVVRIPPRGPRPNGLRLVAADVNAAFGRQLAARRAARCAVAHQVHFFHFDDHLFVSPLDQTISPECMYDYLHFTQAGYAALTEPLFNAIKSILNR